MSGCLLRNNVLDAYKRYGRTRNDIRTKQYKEPNSQKTNQTYIDNMCGETNKTHITTTQL